MDFCRSPHCGRRPSFTGLFFSFGSDPCFPAPAHDQYLSCGSLRHAVGVSAAFTTSVIRNIISSGSLLAFPGSMIGAFLSGYLYNRTKKLWAAVLGEFAGTSLIGGLVSYPLAALFMGSSKGAFFYISLFSVSCGAGCLIAFIVLKGIHIFQTNTIKEK